MEFEGGGEACRTFVCVGPVGSSAVVHFTDIGGLSMAVDDSACCPSLHSLNFADVLGDVRVSDTSFI